MRSPGTRAERRAPSRVPFLLLLALVFAPRLAGAPPSDEPARLDFVPPRPGTYQLQRIMRAPDAEVLTMNGQPRRLSQLTQGRITVLGFIYTRCTNPEGCPLAYRVFDVVKDRMEATPGVLDQVQLVTLSFDPERDTPSVMRGYAGPRLEQGRGLRWLFITPRSAEDLLPLLDGFGQDVRYTVNTSTGRPVRELSHVLKIFLIDRTGFVREIYTSTFLHPQSIVADLQTLLLEPPER